MNESSVAATDPVQGTTRTSWSPRRKKLWAMEARRDKVIIAGVGEREASRDAACLAAAFAQSLGGELVLASAVPEAPLPARLLAGDHRQERFERTFDSTAAVLGDFPHRRFDLSPDPETGLRELAEREGASLIVLGRSHVSALGRVVAGTLADRLIAHAPCPVAIAPPRFADLTHPGFSTLGVAYDGGTESRGALEVAASLARDLDASLQIITVSPAMEGEDPELATVREGIYRERLAHARAMVDVPTEFSFERGDPAHVFARYSVEVDLLVVGSHSRGALARAALGSVASELTRSATCPVVVVPMPPH